MKVIIVGGVAGGASAAARLRRLDEKAQIIMFERGEHISFANCGLPYYIGGVIAERKNLLVQTPQAMKARFNIDVRINSEVIKIDRENKEISIKDLRENKIYKESYDKLILAPGAESILPPIPGIDSKRIFKLRNIPDTDAIKSFLDEKKPKKAVVVGGGFIGLEMAENLHHLGLDIAIVEMVNQVMPALDFEMAAILHQHLKIKNIALHLSDGVKSFEEKNDKLIVTLQSGKQINTDLVILSIGVRPEIALAKEAGLTIGRGIVVNEKLETSDPCIYAVGDAIEVSHIVSGDASLIPLAGPANKQGRIAADQICGRNTVYKGTQGTAIAKVFDLTVAFTGLSEKNLRDKGIAYLASITHSASHAGYYPKAVPMSVKLLFSPEGLVLGAQIVGVDGVDKRMDVFSTAIRHKLTVVDLTELELSYAPPFSSAKDPVNMAGYVAANIVQGDTQIVSWHEIEKCNQEGALLLDVRDKEEHESKAIANSLNIPVDDLRANLASLPRDKKIIIYCQVGLRGYLAHRILKQHGFDNVWNLSGGFKTYMTATFNYADRDSFSADQIDGGDLIKMVPRQANQEATAVLDTCGLQCPGPILQLANKMKTMQTGQTLQVRSTDLGFALDVQAWSRRTNNRTIEVKVNEGIVSALVQKGMPMKEKEANMKIGDDKTIVVFSNDLDKVIASFIIANGALAMHKKVTMFFTFWGLSVLRKKHSPKLQKSIMEKMFGWMLPKGIDGLNLSKMHMVGMGTKMMKMVMKDKQVNTLGELMETAQNNGIRLMACQMSMDVMGIKKEELIDGVDIGGVATYLDASESANMNLFI